jgi:hypothetical protein
MIRTSGTSFAHRYHARMNSNEAGLVPYGLDYEVVAPFIYLTLTTLYLLGTESAVKQYLSTQPEAHRAMRDLSTAVAGAGVRVRDSGRVKDEYDVHMELYTAEEFWLFNLAIDVIAMLTALGGFSPGTRALVASDMESLDGHVHSHHWKREVKKAGAGPAQFHDLRAYVPHHTPQS